MIIICNNTLKSDLLLACHCILDYFQPLPSELCRQPVYSNHFNLFESKLSSIKQYDTKDFIKCIKPGKKIGQWVVKYEVTSFQLLLFFRLAVL